MKTKVDAKVSAKVKTNRENKTDGINNINYKVSNITCECSACPGVWKLTEFLLLVEMIDNLILLNLYHHVCGFSYHCIILEQK